MQRTTIAFLFAAGLGSLACGGEQANAGDDGAGAAAGSGALSNSGGTGGAEPSSGYCGLSCQSAADCCYGNPYCPSDVFPNNPKCEAGICIGAACVSDAECVEYFNASWFCFTFVMHGGEEKACSLPCASDADCQTRAPNTTCSGVDTVGNRFCSAQGEGCQSSADCNGAGTCDTDSGACVCEQDGDCTSQYADTCIM